MVRNSGNLARAPEGVGAGEVVRSIEARSQRKTWRGAFALGVLLVTAAAGYGLLFVVIDKLYKGGGLGIL